MRKLLALLVLAAAFVACGHAQQTDNRLDFAFAQLKSNGAGPFARALFVSNPTAAQQLETQLGPLVSNGGGYIGYDVLSRKPLTSRIDRYIVAIYYEKYPVFLRIDSYRSSEGRLFLPAIVSLDADKILPAETLEVTGR